MCQGNTQLPASACQGRLPHTHTLPSPISTCTAPPAFATVHTLAALSPPYPDSAGKGCSLPAAHGGPCFLLPWAPQLFLSLHSLSFAYAPWITSGSQSHRWNCSFAPTAHITALTLCHKCFAGKGEGWYKLCKAQCPLYVLGVNFQKGWSFTVGTRLCSLSWVSSFQAELQTKSWAFLQLHTCSTLLMVPGSAGPRIATHMAPNFLL